MRSVAFSLVLTLFATAAYARVNEVEPHEPLPQATIGESAASEAPVAPMQVGDTETQLGAPAPSEDAVASPVAPAAVMPAAVMPAAGAPAPAAAEPVAEVPSPAPRDPASAPVASPEPQLVHRLHRHVASAK